MPAVNAYQTELNMNPKQNLGGGAVITGGASPSNSQPMPPPRPGNPQFNPAPGSPHAYTTECHDAATGANNWACWRDGFAMRLSLDGKTVLWSTLLGGTGDDGINGITVDPKNGDIYVSGEVESPDFATTAGSLQQCHNGNGGYPSDPRLKTAATPPYPCHVSPSPGAMDYSIQSYKASNDAFVTRFSAAGAILASTFLGGTEDEASGAPAGNFTGGQGTAIAINFPNGLTGGAGFVYVTGFTESSATDRSLKCGQNQNEACPTPVGFPVTASAFQADLKSPSVPGVRPAHANTFLTKLDLDLKTLVYSTYVGGTGDDEAYAIAVDSKGAAYVVGYTDSYDFPTRSWLPGSQCINGNDPVAGACEVFAAQYTDAFIYKIDTTLAGAASLVYSTYLGGSADEEARAVIYIDRPGFKGVYVAGFTASDGMRHDALPGYPMSPSCDPVTKTPPGSAPCPGKFVVFPTTPGAFQRVHSPDRVAPGTGPDTQTPLPAEPNEELFIVKIADI
jgi:hypothetical protein